MISATSAGSASAIAKTSGYAANKAGVANRNFSEALARAFETHDEKDVAEVNRRQAEKDEKHRFFMDAMQALRDAFAEFDFTASAYANG